MPRTSSQLVAEAGSGEFWGTGKAHAASLPDAPPDFVFCFSFFDPPSPPHQLLGLTGTNYKDAAIITAYEELAASPPPPGFSRRAVDGRGVLLREAVQQLRAARGAAARAGAPRDALPAAVGLAVDVPLLPGALALLAEVGEARVVVAAAATALAAGDLPPAASRDVALAAAHAHCALAGDALEGGRGDGVAAHHPVAVACAHLARARSLLAHAPGSTPLAPRLAADVDAGLADLAPRCALEQLGLPLDAAHAAARKAAARHVAWLLRRAPAATTPPAPGATPPSPDYVKAALARMTVDEVVAAADWALAAAPPSARPAWLFPGALDAAATAHIVSGFTHRRPSLIAAGESLLAATADGTSVAPRAVALLLLGEVDGAAAHLASEAAALTDPTARARPGGVGAASARARAAAADVEFVAAAAGGRDPLPGLVALAEEWLAHAALPAFRDTAERPPSNRLAPYFDDGRVAAALDALAAGGPRGVRGAVAAAVGAARSGVARAATLQRRAPAPPQLVLPAVPGAPAASAAVAPTVVVAPAAPRAARTPQAVLLASPRGLAKAAAGAAALAALAATALAPRGATPPVATTTTHRALAPVRAAVAAAPATAATASPTSRPPAPVRASPLDRVVASWRAARAIAPPSVREAEAAILAWHAAKADALGPRHATARLRTAAADPWRAAVERDAAAAKAAGWFWSFKLKSVRVERVDASRLRAGGGGAALVSARVREAGDLFARTGKRSDGHSYDNAYAAEYTLVRGGSGKEGGWRVAGVLVTGEPRRCGPLA